MRKKKLIDLTVGDLIKIQLAWYFIKPFLRGIDNAIYQHWKSSETNKKFDAWVEKRESRLGQKVVKEAAEKSENLTNGGYV